MVLWRDVGLEQVPEVAERGHIGQFLVIDQLLPHLRLQIRSITKIYAIRAKFKAKLLIVQYLIQIKYIRICIEIK